MESSDGLDKRKTSLRSVRPTGLSDRDTKAHVLRKAAKHRDEREGETRSILVVAGDAKASQVRTANTRTLHVQTLQRYRWP